MTCTSFRGLYLEEVAWQHISLRSCGCDGCDERIEDVLRELAEYSEALTAGQLIERITGRIQPEYSWEGEGWGRSGRTTLSASEPPNCVMEHCNLPPTDAGTLGRRGIHDTLCRGRQTKFDAPTGALKSCHLSLKITAATRRHDGKSRELGPINRRSVNDGCRHYWQGCFTRARGSGTPGDA
ncbi:DUF6226 family protein [Prescottella equi]|uniref:DUF6226 family protein n=1 Tax=Rhodococcus hoagii TaxID=43767 RepID=UPI0036F19A21